MGTLRIGICDDDLLFGHQVGNECKRILESHQVDHNVVVLQRGEDLLEAGFFDIVLLDIQMEGLSGMETAEKLREMGYSSRIIFLTSHEKYVFAAFDVAASQYLLKPLDSQKLEQVLLRMTKELTQEQENCCTVKSGAELYRIPFFQIEFAEVFGRKISLHTAQGIVTFNGRLDELEQSFPDCFFRCHKSYLVNLSMVIQYGKETAKLKSGESVPIARRKSGEFGRAFLAFLQREGDG